MSGLTVAVVALPLSMAIAVASGVTPERGLFTAIVRRLPGLCARRQPLSDRRPAGAFIVLVAATAAQFGVEGLLLTVLVSGVMLTLIGASGLGALIRYIPHPVTVGFTCGIAVTILARSVA